MDRRSAPWTANCRGEGKHGATPFTAGMGSGFVVVITHRLSQPGYKWLPFWRRLCVIHPFLRN